MRLWFARSEYRRGEPTVGGDASRSYDQLEAHMNDLTGLGRLTGRVWLGLASIWMVGSASGLLAQTVSVTVTSRESGAPIAGSIVYLHDAAGREVARRLADDRGRVVFFRPGQGVHSVRAEMIGRAPSTSDPLDFVVGERTDVRLGLALAPIELEGLGVEAETRCETGRQQGLAAARLWEEARKALTAAALTDEQELYRYHTLLYEQELERDTRVVRRSRSVERQANMRVPFRSRPAAELVREGFVQRSGNTDLYFAPDAGVLLSEEFLETHCFRATLGEAEGGPPGLVGLSFAPADARDRIPDIRGTLWLDQSTAELKWLEFRYVNAEATLVTSELGGRVDFERMPDGGWIIPEWWIRMPRFARQGTTGYESRTYLAGFTEAGGVVQEVQGAGRTLGHGVTGAIDGVVKDSLDQPRGGVRVVVEGADETTTTDSLGRFSFYGLVQGVYELAVSDPDLDALGFPASSSTWAVVNGEATLVRLTLPSARAILYGSCVGADRHPEWRELARDFPAEGIVFGRVVDGGTGTPIEDVEVRVTTPTVAFSAGASRLGASAGVSARMGGVDVTQNELIVHQGQVGLATRTNPKGFFRFCGLPEGHRIDLGVTVDGVNTLVRNLRIPDAGGFVEQEISVDRR